MASWRRKNTAEQLQDHLREQVFQGRWTDTIPGVHRLADELGVNSKTVEVALRAMEREGLLQSQGRGRRRRIVPRAPESGTSGLRVAFLGYDPLVRTKAYSIELLHLLNEGGHQPFFTSRSLLELGMDRKRVEKLVDATPADAWVVSAASRDILEWFAARQTPAFAFFGRRRGIRMAGIGPDKQDALITVIRELLKYGHRRIVMLARRERRLPQPGTSERIFLSELQAAGHATGPYNLPEWVETPAGLHDCLEAMWSISPPTAIITQEPQFHFCISQFLMNRGLKVPADVSLVCTDGDSHFEWLQPPVTHIAWSTEPIVRRVVRWVESIASGKDDRRQTLTKASFVQGGTIGPAKA